jgi:hypothetical protein
MTWKAYAAVSGATVLAGWLASSPPANAPSNTTSPARSARPPAASATADIQEQAERLQTGLRGERNYSPPQRNPFRFEEGGDAYPLEPGTSFEPEGVPQPEAMAPEPAPPAISLSGIAEDQVNGQISRTAIVSSPGGVELLREGNEILGYRVVRIESEAVELVRISDGSTLRFTLAR